MKGMRALLAGVACGLVGALGASSPAQAGTGDALFEKLKSVLVTVVDPDTVEIARFSINRPNEAAVVFTRAAAQDYPFFAIIGAVKAAKNRSFPKIGVFTYERCLAPITAVDAVFAGAGSKIDDAKGRAATDAAMGTATQIAADYAKATTDQARDEAVAQLSEAVPYFGDLPVICAFAFETDLQAERNIQMLVNQTAQDVRTAYAAFKSGDVVTGASVLFTLGLGKEVVCTMIDNAIGGGIIGRTPILGDLAKGACAGFVGAVIDGIKGVISGGVGAAEAGVKTVAGGAKAAACAVYSLVGSGCSEAEPPPTGLDNANAWCAARGGVESFLSKTNQADDYSMKCNDGSRCVARPGAPVQCATAQEIAARRAQLIAENEAEFKQKLPQWQASFDARWQGQCPDAACRTGLGIVRLNATLLAQQAHEKDPEARYQMATYFILEAADRLAVSVIEESRYRLLPPKWAAGFRARWNEDCEDEVCRNGIAFVAGSAQLQVHQKAKATPRPPYSTMSAVYAAADEQAAVLVSESAQRAIEFNKTNTANAAIAWELLTNAAWGRQCADAACVAEVAKLAAQMRVAANLVQMGDPSLSSLAVQGKIGPEYGAKFKAAVDASKARVAAASPKVPVLAVRAPGALQPLMQVRRFETPSTLAPTPGARPGGRPAPRATPAVQRPGDRAVPAAPARSLPLPAPPAPRQTVPGRVSGEPSMTLERGTDRMGGDYRGFELDDPDPRQCRDACAADARCRAYTFVNPGVQQAKAMCYLKQVVPAPTRDGCCTSGERIRQ